MLKDIVENYLIRVCCVVVLLFGVHFMYANSVTTSDDLLQSMGKHMFRNNDNRLLNPAQPVVAMPKGMQTSGESYSAARLQAGSAAKMQSYGEYMEYSHGGGVFARYV